ncbi:MAG TPA: hypothetical protein VIE64_00490 [Solirubrobacterales bacterium]|jgi:hypothetical protein
MYTTEIKPKGAEEAEVTEGLDREVAERVVARAIADRRGHEEVQPGDEEDARDLVYDCRHGGVGSLCDDDVRVRYAE